MVAMDEVANKAATALREINRHAGALWVSAHHQGVCDGIELAAGAISATAEGLRKHMADDPGGQKLAAQLAILRDEIRLMSLQVSEPTLPDEFTPSADGS